MNKFNEFDLIKTPRNWIDEVTATNFEPTKRAKVIRIKYIFAIVLIVMTIGISSLGITYAFSASEAIKQVQDETGIQIHFVLG